MQLADYLEKKQSFLPDRLYYDNQDVSDNPALLAVKPIGLEEGRLLNGPVLQSAMEKAFLAAGGDKSTCQYAEHLTVNGVSLSEFTGSIVDIVGYIASGIGTLDHCVLHMVMTTG